MAIPDFQTLMLPILEFVRDGQEHSNAEVLAHVCERFGLTDAEMSQTTPSGRQTTIVNRIAWAKVHMIRAGLLETVRRAVFRIAPRGSDLLVEAPERVSLRLLQRYPEYAFWRKQGDNTADLPRAKGDEPNSSGTVLSPEEDLERAYQLLRDNLCADILDRLRKVEPGRFENIVLDLLVAMGYGGARREAAEALGRPGDEGIDGVINEDRLGLDKIYIQAKRWEGSVGRPEIQKFVGALSGRHARKGVFLTTSEFTKEARQYAANLDAQVVLVDGFTMASHMVDHGVGVSALETYTIQRVDSDYFEEE